MTNFGALLVIMSTIVVYFLPALVAIDRAHRNAIAICVLNVLLGWTFLGWVVALVWAFTSDTGRANINRLTDDEFEELKKYALRGDKA